jgi:hypothetical protein
MPYKITSVKGGYKVVAKDNPSHVYAYHTKNPKGLIQAIEIAKHKNKKSK